MTESNDVQRWDGSSWEGLVDPRPTHDAGITAIVVGPDGRLWVGGAGWVARWDGTAWTTVDAEAAVLGGDVVAIGRRQRIARIRNGFVSRFDGRSWTTYTEGDGMQARPSAVVATSDGAYVLSGGVILGLAYEHWVRVWPKESPGSLPSPDAE